MHLLLAVEHHLNQLHPHALELQLEVLRGKVLLGLQLLVLQGKVRLLSLKLRHPKGLLNQKQRHQLNQSQQHQND